MAHPSPEDSTGNWAHLYAGLQASTLDFYTQVEAAVAKRSIPGAVVERIEYREGGALSDKRLYLRIRRRRDVFDVCGAPFGDGFFFSWWMAEHRPPLPILLAVLVVFGYFMAVSVISGVIFRTLVYLDGPELLFGPARFISLALFFFLAPLGLFIFSRLGNQGADDFILSIPVIRSVYRKIFRPITYYRIDTAEMFKQAVRSAVMEVIDQVTAAKGVRALTELERKPVMRQFAAKA